MQIKKTEDLTEEELVQRMMAIDPLCGWEKDGLNSSEEFFMQSLWGNLASEHFGRGLLVYTGEER